MPGSAPPIIAVATACAWTRGAIDETEGEITLADEIEEHVEFDERQRRQLRAIVS